MSRLLMCALRVLRTMTRCALYLRYSSDLQNARSIQQQKVECEDFAFRNELIIQPEHIYADEALSGRTEGERPAFKQLLQAARQKPRPFDRVIMCDTSRLARGTWVFFKTVYELRELGVYVDFVDQGLSSEDEDWEEKLITSALADARKSKSGAKHTRRGLKHAVMRGYNVGDLPYGYASLPVYKDERKHGLPILDGCAIIIAKEQARTVRLIFWMYVSRKMTCKDIARALNTLNDRRKAQGKLQGLPRKTPLWAEATIATMLKNERYAGTFRWGKTKTVLDGGIKTYEPTADGSQIAVNEKHPAIVSRKIWEETQKRIAELRREKQAETGGEFQKAKRLVSRHPLTRVAKCACGATFAITRSHNGSGRYGCMNNYKYGATTCANELRIDKAELEEHIIFFLGHELVQPESLQRLTVKIQTKVTSLFAAAITDISREGIERRIEKLDLAHARLCSDDLLGLNLDGAKLDIARERQELQNSLAILSIENSKGLTEAISYKDVATYFENIIQRLEDPRSINSELSNILNRILIDRVKPHVITVTMFESNHFKSFAEGQLRAFEPRLEGVSFEPYEPRTFGGDLYVDKKGHILDLSIIKGGLI